MERYALRAKTLIHLLQNFFIFQEMKESSFGPHLNTRLHCTSRNFLQFPHYLCTYYKSLLATDKEFFFSLFAFWKIYCPAVSEAIQYVSKGDLQFNDQTTKQH